MSCYRRGITGQNLEAVWGLLASLLRASEEILTGEKPSLWFKCDLEWRMGESVCASPRRYFLLEAPQGSRVISHKASDTDTRFCTIWSHLRSHWYRSNGCLGHMLCGKKTKDRSNLILSFPKAFVGLWSLKTTWDCFVSQMGWRLIVRNQIDQKERNKRKMSLTHPSYGWIDICHAAEK